jgi:hypothetical protein
MRGRIIGLRTEKFVNGRDIEDKSLDTKYIFYMIEEKKGAYVERKYQIEVYELDTMCPSGYTEATYGCCEVKRVYEFGDIHYTPKMEFIIEVEERDYNEDISNEIFDICVYGGDGYYPNGHINVNLDLFVPTIRYQETRPVWIFRGTSHSGKSYLAHQFSNKEIYETDSNEELPEAIYADVIVLGNKYAFDIKVIEDRIFGEHELIVVEFGKWNY